MTRILAAAAFALALAGAARADMPTAAVPEAVGLSSERLGRITSVFEAEIASGALPGAQVLIQRQGRLAYAETFGVRDPEVGDALADDAIYRIYSMTKPIVSVGLMMLVEEGKVQIGDPVSKWIPALGGLQVANAPRPDAGDDEVELVAAKRDITVQDLLRHTSGLTYGVFGDSWVKRKYKAAGIHLKDRNTGAMTAALGELALMYQPGEVWHYSRSTDVIGYLIEVVSGQSLGDYLAERIFAPLGMVDSGFYVPADQLHRVVEPQAVPGTDEKPAYLDPAVDPVYESGGGGLFSTAHDYLRFTTMMLNGGELDGVRLLGPRTVDLMTSNHLAADMPTWHPGYGFGLGFSVRTHSGLSSWPGVPGEYWWAGYAGTLFWVDPAAEMIVIYMSQQTYNRRHYRTMLRDLVNQAIID